MAAFRRRTTFAAPLIITVASCSSGDKPAEVPAHYPGRTWSVFMLPDGCHATENRGSNPPATQEVSCPPGSSGRNVIQIAQRTDKACAVMPGNCFDEKCLETPTDCPLDYGKTIPKKLGAMMEIEKREGECHVEEHNPDCPPNVDCNPPAPKRVSCPPGITEDKNVRIAILTDGSCAIVPQDCETQDCVGSKTDCPR